MAAEKQADKIVVLNRGKRVYLLSDKRRLGPGESLAVSAEEGAKLLVHRDLADASKIVKNALDVEKEALEKKNEALEKENAELKKLAGAPEPAGKGKK